MAATLGTPADDDSQHAAHEHNQVRLDRSRERLRLLERQHDEVEQRDRLRRVMSRLSRLSEGAAAYGDRVPSQNSLYDWSPATDADADDELDQILAELRREQPNTHPEILRVLGQSQLDAERARIRSLSSRLQSPPPADSLRSMAMLQSGRRHPRFSARTREYLQRYQSDREAASRASQQSESRERYSSESAARQTAMQRLSEGRTSLDRERRDMLSRADSYRRGYLDRNSNPPPVVAPMLEHTVKYLSRIRHSNTVDESLNCALDAGFLSKDYFCHQYTDFVTSTDPFTIPPPAETSWLAPGAVLSGCQHATSVATAGASSAPGASTAMNRFRIVDGSGATTTALPALPPPSRPWISSPYSTTRSPSQRLTEPQSPQSPPQDRWPVKVTVHAVDWEKMSLSATMEAYNVPSHPHSHQSILSPSASGTPSHQFTRTSSITTYLEGEILDFNNHTLLTESFKSNPSNDATYWRKLPPFAKMSDDEIVRALTSKKWFTEVLSKEWILMRWKERCFVKSLNRSTSDPVQATASSFVDGPAYPTENTYYPSSNPQPSPYRIVRNPSTGRAEVEITPIYPDSSDTEHATFDDSGCGLTISGFYYVSLRRSDGALEGLYYDPQSSPYQCLRLDSVRGGMRTAWSFR